MYDDRDRPPWLRNLRSPRREAEPDMYAPAPALTDTVAEPGAVEAPAEGAPTGLSRRQLLLLALLLWGNVSILGCLCLLATQVVVL
jgi:hypothetical protein